MKILFVIVMLLVCGSAQATRYQINVRYYIGKQITYRSRSRIARQRAIQRRRDRYQKRIGNNRAIVWVNGKAYRAR
jgi:hypothetical protein